MGTKRYKLSNAELRPRTRAKNQTNPEEANEGVTKREGSPYLAVFYLDDSVGKKRSRISRTIYATSVAEARSKRDECRIDLEREMNKLKEEQETPTLSAWVDTTINERHGLGAISDTTSSNYLREEKYFAGELGDMAIGEITSVDVHRWVVEQLADDVPPSRIRKTLTLIKLSLEHAVTSGVIPYNPATNVKGPKIPRKEPRSLSEEELDRLSGAIAGMRTDTLGLAIRLALQGGGMRRGEICALHISDVSTTAPQVWVRRAVAERPAKLGSGVYEKATKTTSSRRVVPIPSDLWKDLLKRSEAVRAKAPEELKDPYLLGTAANKPMSPTVLSREWKILAAQNGLADVRFHDLRHTYISRLLSAGVDVKTVQSLVGHSSAMTTLDVYAAVDPKARVAAIPMVEQSLPI